MFGRRRQGRHARGPSRPGFAPTYPHDEPEAADAGVAPSCGPFDSADAPEDGVARLDLGSVCVPMPEGAQLQVEVDQAGPVRAVHVLTERGQFTINAFAAPRSARLWNDARRELITKLESEGARVRECEGRWGREVTAYRPEVVLHFIGVNGPRWLLRGVVAGPPDHMSELVDQLRELVRQTVVVRGDDPMPAQAALPLTLPGPMAEQLQQAAAARTNPPSTP